MFFEPAEGYYLSGEFVQDSFLIGTTRRGAHGFVPTEPRMFTGLIVSGAGIRAGVPLPSARQIDIAPTIAASRHRGEAGLPAADTALPG